MTAIQHDGYLAAPPSGSGEAVLVLHAWWGLNDTIKAFCDRLADAGFVVFAPDLYHGQTADTIEGAEALGGELDSNAAEAHGQIAAAAGYLLEHAPVVDRGLTVIGFSLGAYYALSLASAQPDTVHSVVLFYGTGPADFGASRAAYLGHFAEDDEFEPKAQVDAMEKAIAKAGRTVLFYRYPDTGHWFFEPDRADAYNERAAQQAWERTLAFLNRSRKA